MSLLGRLLLAVALVLSAEAAATGAGAAGPSPRVTVIGDSVQASFGFAPRAAAHLGRGLDLRVDARVCRRLVSPSCSYGGVTPETALGLVRRQGRSLGEVVIVNVGYNDDASVYGIDTVVGALRASGVRVVVLVTLRDRGARYTAQNALIRAAARRAARRGDLPQVRVADWNAHSAGRPWFAADGLHLNPAGALGLAELLREEVLAGLAAAGTPLDGRPAGIRAELVPLVRPVTGIAGDGDVLHLAGAGRLGALDARTGRRLGRPAPLGRGEDLVFDGRGAWLRDPAADRITRPLARGPRRRGMSIAGLGRRPLLARAGGLLWAVGPCPPAAGCAGAQALRAVRLSSGARGHAPLGPGRVRAVAVGTRALWLLVTAPGGSAARLERRHPLTARPLGRTRLPRAAAGGALVAVGPGAWVLTGNGQLIGVAPDGRARRVRGRIRAIAGAEGRLWALGRDRRTLMRLDGRTGRVRGRLRAERRLSDRIAVTDDHLWILTASGDALLRVSSP